MAHSRASQTDYKFLALQTSQAARSATSAHFHRSKALPITVGLQNDERAQPCGSEIHKVTIKSMAVDVSGLLVGSSQSTLTSAMRYYEWGEFALVQLLRFTNFR